jgi:hypothetical protein
MTRRLLLRLAGAVAAMWPLPTLRALAWPAAQSASSLDVSTLTAVAEVVLPSSLSAEERRDTVTTFVAWVDGYRADADAGHGYGNTRLRRTGASPAAAYPAQLAALVAAARAEGAASFAALGLDARRRLIESALTTPARVTQLPSRPSGAHVVADFMGLFFHGPHGYNLAYDAAIDREDCRGLDGSDRPPASLSRERDR